MQAIARLAIKGERLGSIIVMLMDWPSRPTLCWSPEADLPEGRRKL